MRFLCSITREALSAAHTVDSLVSAYETSIRTYFVSVESVFEGNPCKNEEIKHLVIIPGGPSGLLRPGGDGEEEARKSEKITYLSHKINCTKLILFRYFARASSSFPKRIRHTARGTSPKKKDTMAPRRKSPTREILPRTGQRYFEKKIKERLVQYSCLLSPSMTEIRSPGLAHLCDLEHYLS